MNFINKVVSLILMLIVYSILERIFNKHTDKKGFKIGVIIFCVIGFILCEMFNVRFYNVDMFLVAIATFSTIDLIKKYKEEKRKKRKDC